MRWIRCLYRYSGDNRVAGCAWDGRGLGTGLMRLQLDISADLLVSLKSLEDQEQDGVIISMIRALYHQFFTE